MRNCVSRVVAGRHHLWTQQQLPHGPGGGARLHKPSEENFLFYFELDLPAHASYLHGGCGDLGQATNAAVDLDYELLVMRAREMEIITKSTTPRTDAARRQDFEHVRLQSIGERAVRD